jgi:excisionase family DNA binding protein
MENYTVAEAAEKLGKSDKTIRRWLKQGKFPAHYRHKGTIYIPEPDVTQLLPEPHPEPPAPAAESAPEVSSFEPSQAPPTEPVPHPAPIYYPVLRERRFLWGLYTIRETVFVTAGHEPDRHRSAAWRLSLVKWIERKARAWRQRLE